MAKLIKPPIGIHCLQCPDCDRGRCPINHRKNYHCEKDNRSFGEINFDNEPPW